MVVTWDEAKRRANLRTHGFDFIDAERMFAGVTSTYEDDRLAYREQRVVTLGLLREMVVAIVHTEEGDHIHVILMRKATKREREIYFESIAN
ncbi:MAG: BrnT family toxin [Candidatus Rokuibacteriota bacterium]